MRAIATCELTGNRAGDFTDPMRFVICWLLLGLLAGGCFHRKAAAPRESYSDVPGLPKTPALAPAEVKRTPKPPKKEAKVVTSPATNATRKAQDTRAAQAAVLSSAEPKASTEKLIVTPDNGLVGKVEMANQNARYVVLSFPIGHLPAMEQRLNVYRRGLKIGEVKVSGPQIEDNVVADIVEGDAQSGDEVRDK